MAESLAALNISDLTNPLYIFDPVDQELLRRCATVHVCEPKVFDEVLHSGLDDAMPYTELASVHFVEKLPGPEYRCQLRDSARLKIFDTWWTSGMGEVRAGEAKAGHDTASQDNGRMGLAAAETIPPALLRLSKRLAEFYAAAGNSLEQLYHLAVFDPPAAAKLLDELFTAADGQFDLPQCSAILRTLEERPPRLLAPELVGPELREMLAAKRVRLDTRVLWAQEYRTTIPYVERNETEPLLEALLKDTQHWLLNLSAPGGMGKSMYIRAVVARHCARKGVPCAKIDFDFVPHLANVAAEPWRLLLRMAEQLNRQLRDSPFQELLTSYGQFGAESDSAVIVSPREFFGSDLSPADKAALRATVLSRFTDVLRAVGKDVNTPVLLIFDTLENLQHGNLDLEALYDLLLEVHARCASVRVILAGRLDLAKPLPPAAGAPLPPEEETVFTRRFGGQNVAIALRGFDEDEARSYLDGRGLHSRGPHRDPRAAVMIAKARIVDGDHGEAGISPFKLALLADIVRVQPTIKAADFERYEDVDLAYLIERVVDRIHDDQVKWLVRYGVVPRLLTRAIVKDVLVRFMLDGMRGQAQQDDATQDPAVEPQLSSPPFPLVKEGNLAVDPEALWQTLYRYTAEYSWVIADEAADALRFHQDVVEPMRRLLRKHLAAGRRILPDLHAACAAYYAERATADPEHRAQYLREAVYHKLQSGDPGADAYWLGLVQAAGDDAATVAALAEEAVFEPPIYDEVARNEAEEMLRFGPGVRMRAHFLLASLLARRAQPTADDWVKVQQRAAAAESLRAAAGTAQPPPVAPGELDYLRARAALGLRNPQEARAICEQALQSPAGPANALDLQILEAEIVYALDPGAAPEHFAHAAGLAAELQQARLGDIAPHWIEALDALERCEEAAEVCARWRAEAGWRGTPDETGRRLVLHMRQYLSMGQERRAAEVGREGLEAWLAAVGGQASALGAWPAYVEAEILLAGQQPAEALVRLRRELDPATGTMSAGTPVGTGTGSFAQLLPAVEADLLARVYLALADALRARPLVEALAFAHYRPQTAEGFGWLAEFCRFHIDVTGDLRAAAEYLAHAQKGVVDAVSDLRCRLLQIRLLARQGRQQDAAQAATALAERIDQTPAPGLRLQIALERLVQTHGADAVQPLLTALEAVVPPSRRLLLLADLQRMLGPNAVLGESQLTLSAILPLVPGTVTPDLDPAVGALRLAEVYGVQDSAAAASLLAQAEAACREPLRLGVLREVYLARDRFGWETDELRACPLPDLLDKSLPDPLGPAGAASAELAGLALLEHAERTVHNLPDLQGAAALLDRAEALLKGGAGLWTARILAARARIAAAQGDPQAEKLVEQAAQAFHALDDDAAADSLRTEIHDLAAGPAASFAPESLGFGLEAFAPAQTPVEAPAEAKGIDAAPRAVPQLSIRLEQDGDRWLVEFQHSDGRRWKSSVPLEEDFAALLRPNPQEAVSTRFLEALQSDWQGLTLRMGQHLFSADAGPEVRALLDGSAPDTSSIAVRLDVVAPELRWLPWELARLDEAAPPLPALPAVGVFYRSLRRARQAEPGDGKSQPILLVQMAGAQSESGTRGSDQTSGGDVQRYYRRQGLEYQVLVQPSPAALQGALQELRPAVVHLVSNLVEMGPQAALAFGRGRGAANAPAAKSATRSLYSEEQPTLMSAGDLGSLFAALQLSPLLVLDVPAPPVLAERLRQFCLRSAFTSDWAAHTQGTALLGVGLGTGDPQDQQTTHLVQRLAAGEGAGAIAQALRTLPALRSDGQGYVRGSARDGGFSPTLLPFAGVSLYTENPEQVFHVKRSLTR